MAEQFTSQEQSLIQRLQNAPQPSLSQSSLDVMRLRILNAMDAPPLPAPRSLPILTTPVITAGVVIIVIVVIIILNAAGVFTPKSTPEPTLVPATATATTTVTPTPSPTTSATTAPEATPEVTPEVTDSAVIVIEGVIEQIEGNVITVYGLPIQVNPSDPILTVIQVGDVIRIEGDTAGSTITIISISVVNAEVNVNPEGGSVWRDDGTCDHPPPDWAPANGWRRRCQGGDSSASGMGMGDD